MPDPTCVPGEEIRQAVVGHVGKMLAGISPGDVVEIHWLDASLNRGVIEVTNRVIATYMRTLGRFVGAFKDLRYGYPHIVVLHEFEESGRSDVSSIPARRGHCRHY